MQQFSAVTDSLAKGLDCLLSREDWELLTKCNPKLERYNSTTSCASSGSNCDVSACASTEPAATVCEIAGEATPDSAVEDDDAAKVEGPRAKLQASQLADESFKKAWADAKTRNVGMFVCGGSLFHREIT